MDALTREGESGRRKIEAIDILSGLFAEQRRSATRLFDEQGADQTIMLQSLETLNPFD